MFPQRLDSPQAYDIAKAMMDGFNLHYRLFRTESARAKHRFETADWHGIPTPAFALRLALGDFSNLVLHGQRAEPRIAQAHGYTYRFPTLQTGLADILG